MTTLMTVLLVIFAIELVGIVLIFSVALFINDPDWIISAIKWLLEKPVELPQARALPKKLSSVRKR